MGLMALYVTCFEGSGEMSWTLFFSAFLMLLFNPRLLRDDLGFQLSYLAMLGLIFICPMLEEWGRRLCKRKKIKEIFDLLSVTVVSQIITAPISLISFHRFSVIAPMANVLILWTFSPFMLIIIFALFLTTIFPMFGFWFFWPSYCLLRYQFMMSDFLSSFKWSALESTAWSWRWGGVYYLILFLVVWLARRRKKIK